MDTLFSQPTQWTLITRAQGDGSQARRALCELVHRYQGTILHYVRSQYLPPGLEAEDVLQDFLLKFHADALVNLSPTRGRFRGWLKTAVLRHVWHARRHFLAEKRGNSLTDATEDVVPSHDDTPEDLAIVSEALDTCDEALRRYLRQAKNAERLTTLQSELPGRQFSPRERRELAAELGLDLSRDGWATLLNAAISKSQKRYRRILCNVVAETLGPDSNDPFDPQSDPEAHPRVRRELSLLWEALCRPATGLEQARVS